MSKNKTLIKTFLNIFCILGCAVAACAESCSTVGAVQNKYMANGCSYTTQTRTCCSGKQWSDWDKECSNPEDCTEVGYWWDGSACVECTNLKESTAHYIGNGGTENKCPFECAPGEGYADIESGYCSTTCNTGQWFNPANNTCEECKIPDNAWATSDGYGSADSCPWDCDSGYHKARNYSGSFNSKTERGCFASVSAAENYFYNTNHNAHDLWNANKTACQYLNDAYASGRAYAGVCTQLFEAIDSSDKKTISCPYVYYYNNCAPGENYEWAEMVYTCSPGMYQNKCVRD